jgi:vesicle-fusing ATPase
MVYGKLLQGGVTRYRLIGSQKRRAGERMLIATGTEAVPSWLQYGGPERSYRSVDMGFCVLMEFIVLPKGLSLPLLTESSLPNGDAPVSSEMTASRIPWNPEHILDFGQSSETQDGVLGNEKDDYNGSNNDTTDTQLSDLSDNGLESTFTTAVGGLQPQIEESVRRVLDGRVLRPVSEVSSNDASFDQIRREEMKGLLELGLQPVRGLLLYGPPGNGKTALAREISRILDARPPKIVAAPELLDRWVGGSERLVRELFADAEEELAICNGDSTKSALHVVVIDEIDAVFRKRSSAEHDSSGEVTRASAVNQILAKLDGINAVGNVLLIGMTNRRELLDEALLRPGRLEVHVEIPKPDSEGRREVLKIHFAALRQRGRLSKPLCEAIDGYSSATDKDRERRRLFSLGRKASSFAYGSRRIRDLAADRWTGDFSGADLAGLVRCAGSRGGRYRQSFDYG